jgi:hypothetical protein
MSIGWAGMRKPRQWSIANIATQRTKRDGSLVG